LQVFIVEEEIATIALNIIEKLSITDYLLGGIGAIMCQEQKQFKKKCLSDFVELQYFWEK